MRKLIAILLVIVLCLSFAACGKKSDDELLNESPVDTAAPSEKEDSAADSGMVEFTDVTLVDDKNVTIQLVNFYEKEVNWTESDGGPQVEKHVTFNIKNKTDQEINVWLTSYIGEETMSSPLSSGGSSVDAGRSSTVVYGIRHDSAPYHKALDSLDELYQLEGKFEITSLGSPKAFDTYDAKFSIDEVLKGGKAPATEEPTTEEPKANMIDLTTEKGTIKYLGFEKANTGLIIPYANQSDPTDRAIILRFEFTNKSDAKQRASSAFIIEAYQNGVELEDSPAYSSKGGDQYKLVGNRTSDILNGGTVTFGEIVVLEDDSPLTIIVTENGGSNSQTMEIDVTKPGSFKPTENTANAASSKGENSAPAAADKTEAAEPKESVKKIKKGDVIKTNSFEFTLNKVELTYEVKPKNTSGYYYSYTAEDGKVYVHIDGEYYNKSQRDVCIRDLFVPAADFNNGYQYEGFVIVDDGDSNFTWVSSYVVCTPLSKCHYHGLVECPEVVKTETDSPLSVTFKIDGTTYQYDIR